MEKFSLTGINKIPRKGEKVNWDYEPAPTVVSVTYDFAANEILVLIK